MTSSRARLSSLTRAGLFLVAVQGASACGKPFCGDTECRFTVEQWKVVKSLSPLPDIPPDPTNAYRDHDGAAALGQAIFFDKRFSGKLKVADNGTNGGLGMVGDVGKASCASCHDPDRFFIDTRSKPGNISLAVGLTTRHSPTLVNLPYYEWWGWGGRHDSMWQQASLAVETPTDTSVDRCTYAFFIYANYKSEYEAVFTDYPLPIELADTSTSNPRFPPPLDTNGDGLWDAGGCRPKANAMAPDGPWEKMPAEDKGAILRVVGNMGKAIVAYESRLISRNAPFDLYVAGDAKAISDSAKNGLALFIDKAACVDCHNGPFFADNDFHNISVPQTGPSVPAEDLGRFFDLGIYKRHPFNSASAFNDAPELNRVEITPDPEDSDKGKFRTLTLRNAAATGPYMHNGVFLTLREVIDFYNGGGSSSLYSGVKSPRLAPIGLTEPEIYDLIAFIETLTGEQIPEELRANPHE